MKTAKFLKEIEILDPDTTEFVKLEVYKHENGGMFAIDSSYLEQNFDDDSEPIIVDPFDDNANMVGVKLLN
jgi:hypothetical protein